MISGTSTDFGAENARAAGLVRQIAAGQRSAEAELIRLYDRRVLVKLRQYNHDADVVSDLRQEVWIRVIEALRAGTVQQPERVCGFVLGTARNVVLEHRKAMRRRSADVDEVADLPALEPGVEALLDRDWLAGRLRECLGDLQERDREILVRHYLREDDKEMTCQLLGLSSLNYNNVLHRARHRLADIMQRSGGLAARPRLRRVR